MATATKPTRGKSKKQEVSNQEHTEHNEEQETDITVGKSKKPIEIDEPEPVVGIDEKIEEDPLLGSIEDDEASEEISLDGEELNPFGDRWEE